MSESISSISSILNTLNVKKYIWRFATKNHPSTITVLARSLQEARQEVLVKLRKIAYLSPQYKLLEAEEQKLLEAEHPNCKWNTPEHIAVQQKLDTLKRQLNIDADTGCFCAGVFEHTPSLLVEFWSQGSHSEITLEKLISETDPVISQLNTMTLFSCLDG